jgi:hypothetical protein
VRAPVVPSVEAPNEGFPEVANAPNEPASQDQLQNYLEDEDDAADDDAPMEVEGTPVIGGGGRSRYGRQRTVTEHAAGMEALRRSELDDKAQRELAALNKKVRAKQLRAFNEFQKQLCIDCAIANQVDYCNCAGEVAEQIAGVLQHNAGSKKNPQKSKGKNAKKKK